jgi:hypothetical protein
MECPLLNVDTLISNPICNVSKVTTNGDISTISKEIYTIASNSIRKNRKIDFTELYSLINLELHLDRLSDGNYPTRSECSEGRLVAHYDKTVGPNTSNKSVADGVIFELNDDSAILNLCSVFRYTSDGQGKINRKIEKLLYVALHEHNPSTSYFHENFKDKQIDNINLHFYIWVPHICETNPIRNTIKKVIRNKKMLIPSFINLTFNIFHTEGIIEELIWKNGDGYCYYLERRFCKRSKNKKMHDIIYVINQFNEQNDYYICDTLKDTLFYELFNTY